MACRRGHGPASVQSRRRRQHATPAAADRLGRHVRPGHAHAQNIDDPAQGRTVVRRQSAGIPTPRRWRRQQRSDTNPQIIRHKIIRRLRNSAAHQPDCQVPDSDSRFRSGRSPRCAVERARARGNVWSTPMRRSRFHWLSQQERTLVDVGTPCVVGDACSVRPFLLPETNAVCLLLEP